MPQCMPLWQDAETPLPPFRMCVRHSDESEDKLHMVQWNLITIMGCITQNSQHHGSKVLADHAHDLADPNFFGHAFVLHMNQIVLLWNLRKNLEMCLLN